MPFGILLLGTLAVLAGVFGVFWGFALSGVGGFSWLTGVLFSDSLQFWGSNALGAGLASMAFGVIEIVAGVGLLARQAWARVLALVATAAAMIAPAISLFHGDVWGVIGVLLPGAVFLYLLLDQDVKAAFRRDTHIPT